MCDPEGCNITATALIARTPANPSANRTAPTRFRMMATLPETREADDALTLVRAGVLRGLSLEFRAGNAPIIDGVRTVRRGGLLAGLRISRYIPAYTRLNRRGPRSFEIRQDGDGLEGAFFYDVDTVISDRAQDGGEMETRRQ